MLESLENPEQWGRYTFLGYDPRLELTCTNGQLKVDAGTKISMETKDPGQLIKQIIEENKSPRFDYLPPFTGGLVGYFSYDYIKYSEPTLKLDAEDQEGFKDVDLMLFDKVIAFDNLKQKIILIVNIKTQQLETNYKKGVLELEQMTKLIQETVGSDSYPAEVKSDFRALFKKDEYCRMVRKAKEYIREGEHFSGCSFQSIRSGFCKEVFSIPIAYCDRPILLLICFIFPVRISKSPEHHQKRW